MIALLLAPFLVAQQLGLAELETRMFDGNEQDWAALWTYAIEHPRDYMRLMTELNADMARYRKEHAVPIGVEPSARFTAWVHARIEADEQIAQQHARFGIAACQTIDDALTQLSNAEFPSTRRIGIERVKIEAGGKTFGYVWQRPPSEARNVKALGKIHAWRVEHPGNQLPAHCAQ